MQRTRQPGRHDGGSEARLRAAEERLVQAEVASGIGTFDLDLSSGQWQWSAQLTRLFGIDPQQASSSVADWEKVVFIDDVPKIHAALDTARRTGFYHVEIRVRHPDGSLHWLCGRGSAIRDDPESPPRLLGAYHDISDRKMLEARLLALNETLEARVAERARQLAASTSQLEETEHRFRLLVEAVTDYAIFMLDPDGNVVSWNPGVRRIKGYSREEILGRHFSVFYTEKDRLNGVPTRALAAAAQTGKFEAEGWRVRSDGSTFWASVVINAVRDQKGKLLGFAKVTRDLTEKRSAEERLHQAQKMEAIGQLTGGIAHDFNNLLTIITGNIGALQRRLPGPKDSKLHQLSDAALKGAERAGALVHRLLAFSRLQPLDPKPVSVNSVIASVSEMLRRSIGEAVRVETVLAGGLWPTYVDANQLENAVLNLAINARDAMPRGGKLTIEAANVFLDEAYAQTAEIAPGQYVGIFVSDTGTGMAPDVISRAFDPFFTTKEPGRGTGLGLSQVYGFIKQSGGHVKIYSEVGGGTTVKLYLARYFHSEIAAEKETAGAVVPRGLAEVILVVEDDVDVRSFAAGTLRELGYEVLEAADGAEGLRILEAHPEVELVLTDVGLPGGMNGREFADEVNRRLPVKILFTSGYARNAIVHHGRLDRGIEFLAKPFSHGALAMRVRRLLDAS